MIERVIQMLVADGYPSSGDKLAGLSVDAEHYLSQSGILEEVSVRQTGEPECLLAIQATVTSRAQSLQDVSTTLRRAWAALASSAFEASSCAWYQDATVLRFVTVMKGGVFVSGEVVAQGGPYAQLVEKFEHEFGDMHGGLGPRPKRET
jgi:hypothetical protein